MIRSRLRYGTEGLQPVRRVADEGYDYQRTFAERFGQLARNEDTLARRSLIVAEERAVIEGLAADIAEPFGLDWRDLDPLALDTLAWTTVEGEHWRWTGRLGNSPGKDGTRKQTPVVRLHKVNGVSANTEWTAHRILHRLLVTDHEPPGAMPRRAARRARGGQVGPAPRGRCR